MRLVHLPLVRTCIFESLALLLYPSWVLLICSGVFRILPKLVKACCCDAPGDSALLWIPLFELSGLFSLSFSLSFSSVSIIQPLYFCLLSLAASPLAATCKSSPRDVFVPVSLSFAPRPVRSTSNLSVVDEFWKKVTNLPGKTHIVTLLYFSWTHFN